MHKAERAIPFQAMGWRSKESARADAGWQNMGSASAPSLQQARSKTRRQSSIRLDSIDVSKIWSGPPKTSRERQRRGVSAMLARQTSHRENRLGRLLSNGSSRVQLRPQG